MGENVIFLSELDPWLDQRESTQDCTQLLLLLLLALGDRPKEKEIWVIGSLNTGPFSDSNAENRGLPPSYSFLNEPKWECPRGLNSEYKIWHVTSSTSSSEI